jgi:hypothetical protein
MKAKIVKMEKLVYGNIKSNQTPKAGGNIVSFGLGPSKIKVKDLRRQRKSSGSVPRMNTTSHTALRRIPSANMK